MRADEPELYERLETNAKDCMHLFLEEQTESETESNGDDNQGSAERESLIKRKIYVRNSSKIMYNQHSK